MPRLTRLRFVNIGHENARMDDLTLNFCDEAGSPIDSTLWLRNGGGKSSILNLFFSLLFPNRRQFLGAKADRGERSLEDYVLVGDEAVVVAEWQLDAPPGEPVRWYLTGGFYEWRQSTLERLFFASYVHEPHLTLGKLPLRGESNERLTLYGFKQAWQNLGNAYPRAEAHETPHQREWRDILKEARIDPEFGYQLRMNSREGGADELFRFRDTDGFVDFFLGMVFPAERGDLLAQNLEVFRAALRERLELQPSLELIKRVKLCVEPVVELTSERQAHRSHVGELRGSLEGLQAGLQDRIAEVGGAVEQRLRLEEEAAAAAQEAQRNVEAQTARKRSLKRLQHERRTQRLLDRQASLEHRLRAAERERLIWTAAAPFVQVERGENKVRSLEAQLQAQHTDLAPDWNDVYTSAKTLAAALTYRAAGARQTAEANLRESKRQRDDGEEARRRANDARVRAGRADERAEGLMRQLGAARASRAQLEMSGALGADEPVGSALERYEQTLGELEFDVQALTGELATRQTALGTLGDELGQAQRQGLEAQHGTETFSQTLSQARDAQRRLLGDRVLSRALPDRSADEASLNETSLSLLREARAEAERRIRGLFADLEESRDVLEHLQTHDALPPARDVQTVLQALASQGVVASSGWEHVSAMLRGGDAARTFIAQRPELVQGVLVRDAHFERARTALAQAVLLLGAPVVVAPRSLAFGEGVQASLEKWLVVGPTSDAHFDKAAAKREAQALEVQLGRERLRLEEAERAALELRDAADRLERFLEAYPPEWFSQQEAALHRAKLYQRSCRERAETVGRQRHETEVRVRELGSAREARTVTAQKLREHALKLAAHQNQHGTEAQLHTLEQAVAVAQNTSGDLKQGAEQRDGEAALAEARARELEARSEQLTASANRDNHESRSVAYLQEEPTPEAGDVDSLRDVHKRFCDRLDRETDGNRLQLELERAREELAGASRRFEEKLIFPLTKEEVGEALLQVPGRDTDVRLTNTLAQELSLREAVGEAKAEAKAAQFELEQHRKRHLQRQVTLILEEPYLSEEELEKLAHEAESAAETALAEMGRYQDESARFSKQTVESRFRKQQLEAWYDKTRSTLGRDDLFKNAPATLPATFSVPPTDEQVSAQLEDLEKVVQQAVKRHAELLTTRQKLWKNLLESLGDAPFDFARALRQWTEEDLERGGEQLLRDLVTREKNVREALEESSAHRETLLTAVLSVAEQGAQALRSLTNNSKLPDTAGTLAGYPFLKINLTPASEPRGQIGSLLDAIVAEGPTPDGVSLVQRAVRKLTQPIRVSVLFPDLDAPPRYVPITAMAKESGGERLTSAVLLYCALAQQRAKEQGRSLSISSPLLLDNPIGAASRAKFLELQRETARRMNIQLIYATGVNDYEAVRTLPNVVRLRNEQRNTKNQGLLEVVRLVRPEDASTSGASGAR